MFARNEKHRRNTDGVNGQLAARDSATRSAIRSANLAIDKINRRDIPVERLRHVSSLDELVNINRDVWAEVMGDAIDAWFSAHGMLVILENSNGVSHYYTISDRETGVKSKLRVSNHKTLTHKGARPAPDVNIVDATFCEAVDQIADALESAAVEDGTSFKSPRFADN